MKDEYDFTHGKRGAIASYTGKTRITIMLDDVVIDAARERAQSAGTGCQNVSHPNQPNPNPKPPCKCHAVQLSESDSL